MNRQLRFPNAARNYIFLKQAKHPKISWEIPLHWVLFSDYFVYSSRSLKKSAALWMEAYYEWWRVVHLLVSLEGVVPVQELFSD